jgi:hypothetical protein
MPNIQLIQPCYNELEKLKAEIIAEKKARGEPTKTTFSEVVCMLIKERKISNDLAENSRKLGGGSLSPNSPQDVTIRTCLKSVEVIL